MPLFPQKTKTLEVTYVDKMVIVINGAKWHHQDHELQEIRNSLQFIIKKLNKMSAIVDDLKAKVQAQSDKLDAIGTNVTGVQTDVTALKAKIAELIANGGGATPQELGELGALVDGVGTKIDTLSTSTADLDAATDPSNV